MKEYIKPAIEIVDIKVNNNILAGSEDPNSVAENGINGHENGVSQLGKGNTLWDFDDDDDI